MKRDDITTPISNYFFNKIKNKNLITNYLNEMLSIKPPIGVSSIQHHKNKLGKQKYCILLSVRCWVWEGINWRAYVSKEGVSFELLEDLTEHQVIDAWQDYYRKMI